jgi:outer membrane protein assembly factor BamB
MDKHDSNSELNRTQHEEKLQAALEARRANTQRVRKFILLGLVFIAVVVCTVFYFVGYKQRFSGMLYVTDATGKSTIWIHTRQYIRVKTNHRSSYKFQKNTLHILDPKTSKELQAIELPKSLFPYSQDAMVLHANLVWFIKPFDNSERTDFPAAALIRMNPATGAIVSQTEDFVAEHPELGAGIKNMCYYIDRRKISIETKDGLRYYYSFDSDKLLKENERGKETCTLQGVFFLLGNEPASFGGHRQLLNTIHSRHPEKSWTINKKDLDNGPATNDTAAVMDPVAGSPVYLEGRILAQDGTHALILHRTEVGDNGDVRLTCVDEKGKQLWTLSKDKAGILESLNRKNKENFFSGPGQISANTSALIQDGQFIISLDLCGALALDITTGAVRWVFTNPYDSRN